MASYPNRTKKKSNRTCYEAALHLLQYRGQSESELRKKLKDREYGTEDIEKTVEKLKYYGYVNDESLAEDVFRSFRVRRCYGDTYIHLKMKDRGLPCPWHIPEEEERDNALSLLTMKSKIVPSILTNYRKAASFLLRRGFSSAAVRHALSELDVRDRDFEDEM